MERLYSRGLAPVGARFCAPLNRRRYRNGCKNSLTADETRVVEMLCEDWRDLLHCTAIHQEMERNLAFMQKHQSSQRH
jgi:hypothetical protein